MVAPWLRAARVGALLGLAALPLFLAAHAWLVVPIWHRVDALARGLVLAPAAGALLAVCYHRLRGEPAFGGPRGGALLGLFAAAALLPFAFGGMARTAGLAWWPALVGALVLALFGATWLAQRRRRGLARGELFAAVLLANAFPAFFLTFIADFHDETPAPFPFTAAVMALYVAAGAVLGRMMVRSPHA